jgi:hypothetical protein
MERELGEEQAPVPRLYHPGRGAGKASRGALPVLRLHESAIKPHVPTRGSRTGRAGQHPRAVTAAGGEEPCRRRRNSRARIAS